MSLKNRLNRITNKIPKKQEETQDNKVVTWLIENRHEEFIDAIRKTWRISIKNPKTEKDLQEHDQLNERIEAIIQEYSHVGEY